MTMERIGGHEGMTVYRTADGIRKVATTDEAWQGLQNEARMLRLMDGTCAPELYELNESDRSIRQMDCRLTLAHVTEFDIDSTLYNCIGMIQEIRHKGLRHGDLTPPNIGRWQKLLYALDWQESHLLSETAPPKRTTSDSWQLMDTYANLTGDPRRIARRWMAILQDLGADGLDPMPLKGQTFLDLGCYEGWFAGLAAAEGMSALGIDENTESVGKARHMFDPWARFQQAEIVQWVTEVIGGDLQYDVVTFLSTWPYLVALAGWNTAVETLRDVIQHSGVMFFETQSYGDGPGPEQLGTKMDIAALLSQCGGKVVTELLDLPIEGRDATRTLWSVR